MITSLLRVVSLVRAPPSRTYPCELEEQSEHAFLVPIDQTRCLSADVGAGADEEQDHEQQRLEVEEGRLRARAEEAREGSIK